jgi:hypothetical protein
MPRKITRWYEFSGPVAVLIWTEREMAADMGITTGQLLRGLRPGGGICYHSCRWDLRQQRYVYDFNSQARAKNIAFAKQKGWQKK